MDREASPKWIQRWVKRLEDKFPQCKVSCRLDFRGVGYYVKVYWESPLGWYEWGILLNLSPAVLANRQWFRDECDKKIEQEIKRLGIKEG